MGAFRLAWRNIWRNKRRTILTLMAISFACGILVFFICLQLSAYQASINASVSVFQGHIQVQAKGYLDLPRMRSDIAKITSLREKMEQLPEIRAAASRGFGFALASSRDRSYGIQVVGVEPEREIRVSSIPSLTRQGNYLKNPEALEAVVGKSLAANLKVGLGDELTLLGQARDGSVAATVLTVSGIFESGVAELDRKMIEVPLLTFQDIFAMSDSGHAIVTRLTDMKDLALVKRKIEQLLIDSEQWRDLVVLDWDTLSPGLKQAIELDMSFGWLFYVSLILIVTFSILNTFLMSILERTREFGVMLALGIRPSGLVRLVLLESLVLTVLGVALGVLWGGAVVSYFGVYGFAVSGSEELSKIWNISSVIFPELSLTGITRGPLTILSISALSVLYPALRLLRLEPASAMRAI